MQGITAVRIFSPQLLSVDGLNTNFEMFKMKQKNMDVKITGKSKFEMESMIADFDTLNISQKDTSEVIFEMSPDFQTTVITDPNRIGVSVGSIQQINSDEAMSIKSVNANLQGNTLLDIGHAQIQSLELHIADSSGIILSGGALKKIK